MKFNWINVDLEDKALKKLCIDFEYQLRTRITQFLIKHLDADGCSDYDSFSFDIYPLEHEVKIASDTPLELANRIRSEFELAIKEELYLLHPITLMFSDESGRDLHSQPA